MKRRTFLNTVTSTLALGLLTPRARASATKGQVLLVVSLENDSHSLLRVFDWDERRVVREFRVESSQTHSIAQDRNDREVVYLFESPGSILRFDMRTRRSVKTNAAGTTSSGHGIQNLAGDTLFCTEKDDKLGNILALRSSKTLERVGIAPGECNDSHHVVHMPGSNIVACGNSKGPVGGVTFFDYKEKKVVAHVPLEHPILHLAPISSTELLAGSTPARLFDKSHKGPIKIRDLNFLPGPIYIVNVNGKTSELSDENEHLRFNFSLVPLPTPGSFLSTHVRSGKIFFWKDGKVTRRLDVRNPTNLVISKDGEEFMVVSKSAGTVEIHSTETFARIAQVSDPEHPAVTLASY